MSTAALFHFLEIADEVFARDAAGNSADLGDDDASTPPLGMPPVVVSLTGRGREFDDDLGLIAAESVADSLRLTRNCTIRALLTYEAANHINGDRGTICVRGNRDGTAAERILFGAEIERVDATTLRVRARWQEADGTDAVVAGVTFTTPASGSFFHVAVVRRWIDTTTVQVDYVLNDRLVGSETVSEGDIGNGLGGTLIVGAAGDGLGAYERFLPQGSIIDTLAIETDAMTVEELRQDYRRLTVHQPAGGQVLRSYLPPGEAMTREPTSRLQRFLAACGDGLGFAVAEAERLREDFLPTRAYGRALERWEGILRIKVKPSDTIAVRRARVAGLIRQGLGYSVADIKTALEPLFGLDSSDIDVLEFGPQRDDDFDTDDITTPPSKIWRTHQGDTGSSVAVGAGVCSVIATTNDRIGWITDGGNLLLREAGLSCRRSEDVDGATLVTKIDLQLGPSSEVIYGHVWRTTNVGEALIIGRRLDTGTNLIASMRVVGGVVQAVSNELIPLSAMADPIWLLTRYVGAGVFEAAFSETAWDSGYSDLVQINGPTAPRWCGFGVFAIGAGPGFQLTGGIDADFDEAKIYEPNGVRTLAWYAYRDTALAGEYDMDTANLQIRKQGQAHRPKGAITDLSGFTMSSSGGGQLGVDPLYPLDPIVS